MDKQAISWLVNTTSEKMSAACGIVNRLIQLGVAKKSYDEIVFTDGFVSHLARYSEFVRSNQSTIGSWRHIFGLFHSDLNSSNDSEVKTIIALLDYYLHRIEVGQRR